MAQTAIRAAAAALLLAACDGAAGPGEPARFDVRITTPAVVNETVAPETPVLLTAEGAAAGGAPVSDPARYEWRVHAHGAFQRGNPLSAVLQPGLNAVVVSLKDEAGREVARDSAVITVPRDTMAVRLNVTCTPALLRGTTLPAGCLSASITRNPRGYTPTLSWRRDGQGEVPSPEQLAWAAAAAGDHRVHVVARVPGRGLVFTDTGRVAVRDTLHVAGHVWGVTPAGAVPARGWRVHARVGGMEDSADVGADGSFAFTSRGIIVDSAEVWVDTTAAGERGYHPAWMRLSQAQARQGVRVALVPRAWTIPRGTYAGQTVPVSLDVLLRPAHADGLFYYPGEAVSWDPAGLPVPVAVAHDSSDLPLAAADSARAWSGLEALMAADGVRYFAPAVQPVPGPRRVLWWVDGSIQAVALARSQFPGPWDGFLTEGRAWFRDLLGVNAQVAEHEFRHVLGVGHTCFFPSVMKSVGACPTGSPPQTFTGTEWDAAYMQLLYAMHAEQRRLNARHGIGAGTAGERILMLGRSPSRVLAELARVPARRAIPFHPPPHAAHDHGGSRP